MPIFSRTCSFRGVQLIASAALVLSLRGQSPSAQLDDPDLASLIEMKVTSVSRKEKSVARAAAAVFVITHDDIRRSGLSSIPELLRMVPGMDVARIDANKWAITARGFNERFADKMLVMIDGRSVLTPLSSGVYWDVQDTMIEDIERIEVVRGPGAALWGANAVNGVINIITMRAKDTQGMLVTASSGAENRSSTAARYGGEFGRSGFYRLFGKNENTNPYTDGSGARAFDSFRMTRGGFRADWNSSVRDAFTVQGDLYRGSAGQTTEGLVSLAPIVTATFNSRSAISGGNILGRWQHSSSERFDTTIQVYDEEDSRDQPGVLSDKRRTADLELVQHFSAAHENELTWGGDFRHDADDTVGSFNMSFNPANRDTNLFGVFIQDEIMMLPDKLWLTLGSRLEHNSYSGFALQPSVRVLWALSPTRSLWAAVSGAAENSSRFDADIRTNSETSSGLDGKPALASSFGNHQLPPESVRGYEVGYRAQAGTRFNFDVATFFNQYSNRHTQEDATPFFEGDSFSRYMVFPTITQSNITGRTHGLEASATATMSKAWKVTAGYTYFGTHIRASANSTDHSTAEESEGSSPRHKFQIRSMLNVSPKCQVDTAVYYVGGLPGPMIPQYARFDARFGWQLSKNVEVSAGGQNLLDGRHFEFGSGDLVNSTQVARNFYTKVTWRY